MDFDLPKEVRLLKRTVREFAEQRVAPLVPKMEETGEFPTDLIGEMGALAIFTDPTGNRIGLWQTYRK